MKLVYTACDWNLRKHIRVQDRKQGWDLSRSSKMIHSKRLRVKTSPATTRASWCVLMQITNIEEILVNPQIKRLKQDSVPCSHRSGWPKSLTIMSPPTSHRQQVTLNRIWMTWTTTTSRTSSTRKPNRGSRYQGIIEGHYRQHDGEYVWEALIQGCSRILSIVEADHNG